MDAAEFAFDLPEGVEKGTVLQAPSRRSRVFARLRASRAFARVRARVLRELRRVRGLGKPHLAAQMWTVPNCVRGGKSSPAYECLAK